MFTVTTNQTATAGLYRGLLAAAAEQGAPIMAFRTFQQIRAQTFSLPEIAEIASACVSAVQTAWWNSQTPQDKPQALGSYAELGSYLLQHLNGHPLPPQHLASPEIAAQDLAEVARAVSSSKALDLEVSSFVRREWHESAVRVEQFARDLGGRAALTALNESALPTAAGGGFSREKHC